MQFLVKILKPVVAPVAFYNADAVMNMKTSWPTFHSPDVEIHLHPTCYNYILRKHCSFFFLFFCVCFLFFCFFFGQFHVKSAVVGAVTFYREGSRFGSQLVFLHLPEFSLGFGLALQYACMSIWRVLPAPDRKIVFGFFVEEITFLG